MELEELLLLFIFLLLLLQLPSGVARAAFEFTPLERDRYLQHASRNYWWQIYPMSHKECNNCGDWKLNHLCSRELGPVPPANKSNIPIERDVCIRFHTKHTPTTAIEVLEKLGRDSVINFIGDSNTRKLFIETLSYFGYPNYMYNLYEIGSMWKNKNTRETIDHTNLCAWSLPFANNITLSFSWSRFITDYRDFFAKRPWSRCKAACRATDDVQKNMPNCDHSDAEGVEARWPCGSTLDSVQRDNRENNERSFITVNQISCHDALHVYHGNSKSVEDFYKEPPDRFKMEDEVMGDFKGLGKYYVGHIKKVHEGTEELYDIKYSIDFEEKVPRSRIRVDYSGWRDTVSQIENYFKSLETNGKDKNNFVDFKNKNDGIVKNLMNGLLPDHANKSCWMSSAYRGGREIIMSPLHLRHHSKQQLAGADLVLRIMRESIIGTGLKLFDDFIDAFSISSTEAGAPFSYDGIHYPEIMYRAEIEMIMSQLVGKTDPNNDSDNYIDRNGANNNGGDEKNGNSGGNNDEKVGDNGGKVNGEVNVEVNVNGVSNGSNSHEGGDVDYKSLFEKSMQELKQLEEENEKEQGT